ncbi:hypothetical protein GCM10027037_26880 [Mucilaginibacter koreensis]
MASAQNVSNKGNEFWAVFPTHEPDFDKAFNPLLAKISVFITSTQASSGTISAGSFSQKFTVNSNNVTEIPIPYSASYIDASDAGKILHNRAIHIVVDPGQPEVVVYAHIFAGKRSAASLILPKEALGQQYFSMNYPQYSNEGKNYITVIASEPNTKVFFKKNGNDLIPGGVLLPQVNDVYEYLSDEDLTGVSVAVNVQESGCNRFAMFSGSTGVKITANNCTPTSLDPLFQQCYPTEDWGTEYGIIPFSMISSGKQAPVRTKGQIVRVLAKDDQTLLTVNGTQVAKLNAGQYYTSSPIDIASIITANKPVTVAQYALTQNCSASNNSPDAGYSDPDMVLLNPLEYRISNTTVYSSNRENITEQYINVLMKSTAVASFRINNMPPAKPFTSVAGSSGYSYLQLDLKAYPTHVFTLTADSGFNATAYGFGDVESYAYSAGTNLAASQSLNVISNQTQQVIDSACIEDDYHFKLTLPYLSPKIIWQMDKNEAPIIQESPQAVQTALNGKTTYEYLLSKTKAYQNAGNHQILIQASYAANYNNCSTGNQKITGSFKVIAPPQVAFSKQHNTCSSTVKFTDLSKDNIHPVIGWMWDFGDSKAALDQQTSALQHPTHTYTDTGVYVVTLTATSSTGCQSFKQDTVQIHQRVMPDFTFTQPNCAEKKIEFLDNSQTYHYKARSWNWNFGDNDSVTVYNNTPIIHIYKTPGVYQVTMTMQNNLGCNSPIVTKTLNISAKPQPDFSSSAACLTDAYTSFTNLSTSPEGSQSALLYFWNFGDNKSTINNPNTSTLKNPTHKYSEAKSFKVTLTVTTPNGCDSTIQKTIMVNGVTPKADFEVLNGNIICSGREVTFKDLSRVLDAGKITKLEWYFDATNHPEEKVEITELSSNQLYYHTYPKFYQLSGSKQVTVKLLAYSGNICLDEISKTVTLMPAPQIILNDINSVCINAAPFTLTAGNETSGLTGTNSYTGKGIIKDNLFSPNAAGLGKHEITYHFITANGCTDSAMRYITVVAPPQLSFSKNSITIRRGTGIHLQPQYSGSKLNFQWLPQLGLDRSDIETPLASPTTTTTYTLIASNGTCNENASITVHVLQPVLIYNTFTPNGDGLNDLWNIEHIEDYPEAHIQIFNRWGVLLFQSIGYSHPWDGKYKGADVPAGTYYYLIQLQHEEKPLSGYITLIR